MGELRIGCSGWAYKDWRGPFYPPGVKDGERTRFDTAEIDASFYRLPEPRRDRANPAHLHRV